MKRALTIILGILAVVSLVLGVLAVSTQIPASWHGWIALAASIVAVVQAAVPRVFGDAPSSQPVPVVAIAAKG